MRFRRSRRRGSAEPLHWLRTSFLTAPFQVPFTGSQTSMLAMFGALSQSITPTHTDDEFTVLRVVLNRYPVAHLGADWALTGLGVVVELTWFIFAEDRNLTAIPTGPDQIFASGRDIVAGGTNYAQFFGVDQMVNSWNSNPGGNNWIDTRVNRKLGSSEVLWLWCTATIKPTCDGGSPVVPGEDGACWVIDSDVSILYKRSLRRR